MRALRSISFYTTRITRHQLQPYIICRHPPPQFACQKGFAHKSHARTRGAAPGKCSLDLAALLIRRQLVLLTPINNNIETERAALSLFLLGHADGEEGYGKIK